MASMDAAESYFILHQHYAVILSSVIPNECKPVSAQGMDAASEAPEEDRFAAVSVSSHLLSGFPIVPHSESLTRIAVAALRAVLCRLRGCGEALLSIVSSLPLSSPSASFSLPSV